MPITFLLLSMHQVLALHMFCSFLCGLMFSFTVIACPPANEIKFQILIIFLHNLDFCHKHFLIRPEAPSAVSISIIVAMIEFISDLRCIKVIGSSIPNLPCKNQKVVCGILHPFMPAKCVSPVGGSTGLTSHFIAICTT